MRATKLTKQRRSALKKAIWEAGRVDGGPGLLREAMANGETVDVHVNVETLYNPLSIPSQRQLNDEVFAFIEDSASLLAFLVPIRAVMHGVPDGERSRVPGLVKDHYTAVMKEQLWDAAGNMRKTILLLGAGVLFISIYLALALTRDDSVLLELLSVIGSFALWEAADCFLIERRVIKRGMMKTAQFLTMEIAFEDEDGA